MQSTQTQLQNLAQSITTRPRPPARARQDDGRSHGHQRARPGAAQAPAPKAIQAPRTAAEQLEEARSGLRALQLRLKPEHPDVIRAQRVVRELEQKAAAEELTAPVGDRDRGCSCDVVRSRPEAAVRDAGGT